MSPDADSTIQASPRPIRFFHRGQVVSLQGPAPTRSVLQWLREDARCSGTKEGCNEGDCGACTVVVAELAEPGATGAVGGLQLHPVNACIRFLPTLDGKALLTVEDLKLIGGGALHPAQQALVDCHGSQCGFCTPGFAMTLAHLYEQQQDAGTRPARGQIADALAGNLCRCTGYRPILDAGERMFELPARRLDTAPIVAALKALRSEPALHYAAPGQAPYHAPRTLDELAALRAARPQARLLAGGTDIGLWVNKQFRDLGELIWLGEVAELQRVTEADGVLEIGAGASLERAWSALAARLPALTEMWLRFAGPPVRHAGTMGGNVANGSPIGDSAPVLIALGASIVLRQGARRREMPLQDFYVDYMKNRLEPGEFVQALRVPLPAPGSQVRAWKLSKRFDCDISALTLAASLRLDAQQRVAEVRLAFGGMAGIVRRAAGAEAALHGQPWTEAAARAAMAALDADFQPLSDLRASASYRRRTARNLLWRLWLETRPDAPLAAADTTVWAGLAHA